MPKVNPSSCTRDVTVSMFPLTSINEIARMSELCCFATYSCLIEVSSALPSKSIEVLVMSCIAYSCSNLCVEGDNDNVPRPSHVLDADASPEQGIAEINVGRDSGPTSAPNTSTYQHAPTVSSSTALPVSELDPKVTKYFPYGMWHFISYLTDAYF